MKRLITYLCSAVILFAAALSISSCSKTEYDKLDDMGYTVSVVYDANGGTLKGSESTLIDSFNPNEQTTIKLLDPSDKRRGDNQIIISKPECILAGWYKTRTPIDENDLSKGYTYSGRWDFENDTLTVDANGDYTSATPTLTLYAAWVPYFTFEYYTEDGSKYAESTKGMSITVPSWKTGEATISMGKFPQRSGYTLLAAYSDPECENEITGTLTPFWDPATATVENSTVKIYTKWLPGTHYRIYNADQLRKNADSKGIYTIMDDIDFTDVTWPAARFGKFNGSFLGDGHKISGIEFTAAQGGLFTTIGEEAIFEDISFEDVTYTATPPRRFAPGAKFGLLAGTITEGASFVGVSVSGEIVLDSTFESFENQTDYSIYLLSGCGSTPDGISYDVNVGVTDKVLNNGVPLFTVKKENDEVILEFPED